MSLKSKIDYFCHCAVAPEHYSAIEENDNDFTKTEYISKIEWLKNKNDDLYHPKYTDLFGGIKNRKVLLENLRGNDIPETFLNLGAEDYESFLEDRRKLMAEKIQHYYETLA